MFLLELEDISGQLPRCFATPIVLAILSLPETDPQILERWGCADEDSLGKLFQARVVGPECQRDAVPVC